MALESNTAGIQVNALVTPQKPIAYTCVVTTANTGYTDSPSNSVELVPAQTKGCRITKVTALALSNGVIVMASGFGGTEPTPGFAEFDNFTYAPNVVASTKLVSWQVLPSANSAPAR